LKFVRFVNKNCASRVPVASVVKSMNEITITAGAKEKIIKLIKLIVVIVAIDVII